MKNLIRWGATLGLVVSTILCSGLYQSRSAFALPKEEIFNLLRGIPVFMLVNDKNIPLGGRVDAKTVFTNVFMSKDNAHEFLIQLKKDNPSLAAEYKVELVSLGAIYEVSQNNDKKSEQLTLQYIPTQTEVESANSLLREKGQQYKGGVPLYLLKGGPKQNYLTIKQDKETIIPIFFEKKTIQQVINNLKENKSDQATNIKIEIILLANLIDTLEKQDDEFFRQIRLWPSQEMMKIIQEHNPN